MQDTFIEINSVPTRVYSWGHAPNEKFDSKIDELVLVITGNPGLPGFYTTFCSSLYEQLEGKMAIWVIGHAGHDEPPAHTNLKLPKLKPNKHLYDLNGQVEHKIDLIERIPEQVKKIHVVGHSVGSWIIIDLLRKSQKFDEKVQKCYLMFPTVEGIAQSKSGKFFVAFRPFFFLVHFIVWLFNCLPHGIRERMVKWYYRDMPEEFHEHCLEHSKQTVVEKVLFMASDEMNKITEIDEEMVRKNMHRLKLYYGAKDAWVRKRFYYNLIEKFPDIEAELCTRGYEHAFVLKSGKECGVMVGEWILEHNKSPKMKT